jgi:hypothetical protein
MFSLIYELLTEEQREKFDLREERIDQKGIFTRYRVEDQTIFDQFFCLDLIDRHEKDAIDCFLNDFERGGCNLSSASLEPDVVVSSSSKVGDRLSSKWMAFSSSYREMARRGCQGEMDIIIGLIPVMYSWRTSFTESKIKSICVSIRPALPKLCRMYRCEPKRDPFSMIK